MRHLNFFQHQAFLHARVARIDCPDCGVGDQDGQFFLTSLKSRLKLLGTEPLLADWFTGVLRVPRGTQLAYVHMGFGSVYEEELQIHVERGRVTGTRVCDNRGKEIDAYAIAISISARGLPRSRPLDPIKRRRGPGH